MSEFAQFVVFLHDTIMPFNPPKCTFASKMSPTNSCWKFGTEIPRASNDRVLKIININGLVSFNLPSKNVDCIT